MALNILLALGLSYGFLFVLFHIALKVGLVDKPNERKLHDGHIPLIGGLAVTTTLITILLFDLNQIEHSTWFVAAIGSLAILGLMDDKFDLSAKLRLVVQAALTLSMVYFTGLSLTSFGDIVGVGEISLGWFGVAITVIAVIGSINAFNMVDGIDGLLGGLSIVTLASMSFLLALANQIDMALFCVVIICALIPYMARNMGLLKGKVFMGDAGSMVIGFIVVWFLIQLSQPGQMEAMRPVTALWLIGVPLTDMAAIMIRRVKHGQSPFMPDREHLHHICQRIGLSNRQTLVLICGIALCYASFGIYGEINQIAESTMFILFMACFVSYFLVLTHIWRITKFIRALKAKGADWTDVASDP
ncbi:UDP-N-acetylglucosamine--undecaprenyl-phosphate N-acetylglucosaminephosphotransferase [Vibrio sp. SCSIO 43136]|uniref:UDP-N-acetylglucosamine--undecaprenyl-phosphate N-acetylglucosaminephosphotransferase n=1 Tax=Vibrio sp. SCSIO 43136 TaxID=2819101 RepID=UPI00207577CB|nr:UDP-N-acetylglucosamine--undecaprenyl-phosphate N-acetylglucosaminephosphotransferase [Vibrio sp. SCSIO 43136]USD65102.1 UDP-N-acetylglucosamine--undecaprenyl-phosphate N-acetylglucosaminephosphotransferase [Vibrio sp. SCSIO 43136]